MFTFLVFIDPSYPPTKECGPHYLLLNSFMLQIILCFFLCTQDATLSSSLNPTLFLTEDSRGSSVENLVRWNLDLAQSRTALWLLWRNELWLSYLKKWLRIKVFVPPYLLHMRWIYKQRGCNTSQRSQLWLLFYTNLMLHFATFLQCEVFYELNS